MDAGMAEVSDELWLVILNTENHTLGYVRIDDQKHDLSLCEIRQMIFGRLKNNPEYINGWQFLSLNTAAHENTLPLVAVEYENSLLAKHFLPAVAIIATDVVHAIVSDYESFGAQYMAQPSADASTASGLPKIEDIGNAGVSQLLLPIDDDSAEHISAVGSAALASESGAAMLETEPCLGVSVPISSMPPYTNAVIRGPLLHSDLMLSSNSWAQTQRLRRMLNPVSVEARRRQRHAEAAAVKTEETEQKSASLGAKSAPPSILDRKQLRKELLPPPIDLESVIRKAHSTAIDSDFLLCRVCDKSFKKLRGYRQHMYKIHAVKTTQCIKASKHRVPKARRASAEELSDRSDGSDQRTVGGRDKSKRYECDKCARRFYQSSDLKRHQRVHDKVKPFVCTECTKSFTQRGSLYRHYKSNHPSVDVRAVRKQLEEKRRDLLGPGRSPRRQRYVSLSSAKIKTQPPTSTQSQAAASSLPPLCDDRNEGSAKSLSLSSLEIEPLSVEPLPPALPPFERELKFEVDSAETHAIERTEASGHLQDTVATQRKAALETFVESVTEPQQSDSEMAVSTSKV